MIPPPITRPKNKDVSGSIEKLLTFEANCTAGLLLRPNKSRSAASVEKEFLDALSRHGIRDSITPMILRTNLRSGDYILRRVGVPLPRSGGSLASQLVFIVCGTQSAESSLQRHACTDDGVLALLLLGVAAKPFHVVKSMACHAW
jgi:hypothetical protein